ncbi:MAG: hypothetical protein M0D53_17160 [Flavobacterium sp. JAD_PAG50586_2]|nr:MAG: hypothetical protein M0D53_17160 [Flavobacterium sp. JAD_PAG50586_2]
MTKLDTNDFFKATVDNLFFYRYGDMMVVRTASGFTKETRTTNPKYENCTRSANEFGRVSSLCKQVRLALSGILPKQNNRAMVYSFTKKCARYWNTTPPTQGENASLPMPSPQKQEGNC